MADEITSFKNKEGVYSIKNIIFTSKLNRHIIWHFP